MEVKLLTSPASIKDMENLAAQAALTCHANADKPYVPREVLKRIIKAGHESILEHNNLTYSVKGISRALLQELARHRLISLSVESTRHTLRQYMLKDKLVLSVPEQTPEELRWRIASYVNALCDIARRYPSIPNDFLKYAIPEAVCTNLILTVNIRELRHILTLRTAPAALAEFQILARKLYEEVPAEFQYLLTDCVYKADE